MKVGDIINSVRLCFDEEPLNVANLDVASSNDNTLMDHIIKAKIGDAIRWICLYAPAELLGGSDETKSGQTVSTGILVDKVASDSDIQSEATFHSGEFALPVDFIKLVRVKVDTWKMAMTSTIDEGTEEYMQLIDENGATATAERPKAVIINQSVKKLQIWPTGTSAAYTYVANVDDNSFQEDPSDPTSEIHYPLPPKTKTAFIYYLAFLVLSAYEDSRAARMLEIAKMNLGLTYDKQRA